MQHRETYFPLPSDDLVHFWSQDKHSIIHVTGFLRTSQEMVWGLLSPSYLPSPFISHTALKTLG